MAVCPMSPTEEATARRPARRRAPWSLRSIVVQVTGKPISEFQEKGADGGAARSVVVPATIQVAEEVRDIDPVDHIYPPLSGAHARQFHGSRREHHLPTLERHRDETAGVDPLRGPYLHPERLYLHYLLLHLDRLTLPSLWYLRRQVNDEIASRARRPPTPPPPSS